MTEIPEHLLKRAQARRAAMAGGEAAADAPAAATASSADAPAPAAAAAAAPAAPAPLPTLEQEEEKAKPDIPVVAAAKRRKRVPYWAAPVLVLLPVWGILYRDATIPPPNVETDPIVIGGDIFPGTCAGCHGASGEGTGAGAQIADGHVLETFPDPLANVNWVAFGHGGAAYDDDTYGTGAKRPQINGGMPAFQGSLTPREIAAVVIYIRSQFSPDQYDPNSERGFTAEAFEEDSAQLEAWVEEVISMGGGPDPDFSGIDRPDA